MLKRRSEQIQFFVKIMDVAIAVAAFVLAYWLRSSGLLEWAGATSSSLGSIDSLTWILALSLALHFITYQYFGFYQSLRLKSVTQIVSMILRAALVEFFVLGAFVFLFQAKETSRYFFGLFVTLNYALVLVERIGARVLLSSIRRRGYNYRQVLIVGEGINARRAIDVLRRNKHWGYVPFGVLAMGPSAGAQAGEAELDGVEVLGQVSDLERVVNTRAVDEVMFAPDDMRTSEITAQVALCEKLGIPARISLGFFELSNSRVTFSNLDELPVVTFYTTLMTPVDAWLKRCMDIVIALIGLGITAVFYPWIVWRIRRESPGPVIFKQVRVGENGRRFKCYKFRTMHLDAETQKEALLAANQMQGPIFKIENDPRVTKFGAFLRRTSLDELPQFFNILRGDMSVVGTRPPTPDEVRQYQTHYRRRLSIRPGLTGLWQVSGRNQVNKFEDILKLDLQYIDRWSLWLDIEIIFRTIWVLLFRRGAY